jgi:hypothetical protein
MKHKTVLYVEQNCFLLYARLHVSTLIIDHLQAFLQLSSQILCMLASHHVYINKNIKNYASLFMSLGELCYRTALKAKLFKIMVLGMLNL